REIALDVCGKYGDAGAGKAFRHHLQRHGLAGAGGAGDETMPIGKIERQPCRLLALADKYLVGGICQFVVGRSHRIASSSSSDRDQIDRVEHTSSCDAIETGQRAFEWIEKVASSDQSAPQTSPKVADDPASATI